MIAAHLVVAGSDGSERGVSLVRKGSDRWPAKAHCVAAHRLERSSPGSGSPEGLRARGLGGPDGSATTLGRPRRPLKCTPSGGVSQGQNTTCSGALRCPTATSCGSAPWVCPRLIHEIGPFVHILRRSIHRRWASCQRSRVWSSTGRPHSSSVEHACCLRTAPGLAGRRRPSLGPEPANRQMSPRRALVTVVAPDGAGATSSAADLSRGERAPGYPTAVSVARVEIRVTSDHLVDR